MAATTPPLESTMTTTTTKSSLAVQTAVTVHGSTSKKKKNHDKNAHSSPSPKTSSTVVVKTLTLTTYHVWYALLVYLVLPLSILALASAWHNQLLMRNVSFHHTSDTWTGRLVENRILILGFDTSRILWTTIYKRIVSVSCWGLTFVWVRKGCNPVTRHHFWERYWKGAVLSTLSVFYSTFGRTLLQHNWPAIFKNSAAVDAILVGCTWAMANAWIRRRLDPKSRPHLCKATTLRDLCYGALSFAASAYGKTWTSLYLVTPLKAWCRMHLPVPATAVTQVTGWCCNVPADKFWATALNAMHVGLWYTITYLFIRRGANPDCRQDFVRVYGADACFGGLALFCYMYLKLAAFKWLPILISMVLPLDSLWDNSGTSADGVGEEL